jgi:RNA polymerase sigma factor (sigma-70 family)
MGIQVSTHTTLLARLADGSDRSAWDDFHECYGELIRRFGAGRGMQPADCDDLVQEVLLALSGAMRSFVYDPAKGSFRAYLKTITIRAVSKVLRKKHAAPPLALIEDIAEPGGEDGALAAAWETEWRANHVRRAMRLLEGEFKVAELRAFRRYAIDGQDAREVAAALGQTVNQVYQAKSRITKRLTELIELQVQDEG